MLSVQGVSKRFGTTRALDDVSIDVGDHTVAILGPSGCGKSTLLRVIAGLERPDAGRVYWDGDEITTTPAHLRDFGLMFQTFALFPHRTVGQNVSFGLEMHGVPAEERDRRVAEALTWVMACRAARSSESRWPGPWHRAPGWSCSTSRSVRSTDSFVIG